MIIGKNLYYSLPFLVNYNNNKITAPQPLEEAIMNIIESDIP